MGCAPSSDSLDPEGKHQPIKAKVNKEAKDKNTKDTGDKKADKSQKDNKNKKLSGSNLRRDEDDDEH